MVTWCVWPWMTLWLWRSLAEVMTLIVKGQILNGICFFFLIHTVLILWVESVYRRKLRGHHSPGLFCWSSYKAILHPRWWREHIRPAQTGRRLSQCLHWSHHLTAALPSHHTAHRWNHQHIYNVHCTHIFTWYQSIQLKLRWIKSPLPPSVLKWNFLRR